jgi:ATP-dependent Lhr-like helicase
MGRPVAVFERRGALLRVFDGAVFPEAADAFARGFSQGRIFPNLSRITVKEYPEYSDEALEKAGFVKVMGDYVLYRKL